MDETTQKERTTYNAHHKRQGLDLVVQILDIFKAHRAQARLVKALSDSDHDDDAAGRAIVEEWNDEKRN